MKKILLSLILGFMCIFAVAQVPESFSYQAIVRDGGEVLQNQLVSYRFSITKGTTSGSVVYTEKHNVTTNQLGLVNLAIGNGTDKTGDFSTIDWGADIFFLKVELDPEGGTSYVDMGTTQLMSVPYAMYAKTAKTANYSDLTNKPTTLSGYGITDAITNSGDQTISGKTTLKGTTPDMEAPLFEVKNKDGQTIFAVYNEGIRIWVSDGAKGTKGGFVIGGFDEAKGTITDFLKVSTDETDIINPSENRILWYPIKNAFLTGKVLIENPDSVGENSFASGYESKAAGAYSQALGYQSIARGDYSTAIGKNAVAAKINSFAFGENAMAKNAESYALGKGAIAEGFRSFAFGSAGVDSVGSVTGVAYAKGDYSFAIGQGSQAIGLGSFAIGIADTASGEFCIALGYNTSSKNFGSTSMGIYTEASGKYSTAMGYSTTASAKGSISIGYQAIASGNFSTAIGVRNIASGSNSTCIGSWTSAPSGFETVIGRCNTIYTPASTTEWNSSDRLFVIGNGTSAFNRSDALVILKDGRTAVGHSSPTQILDVNGNARFRSIGSGTFANNLNITSDGTLTTATSDINMKENIHQITDALDNVCMLRGVTFTWKNDSSKIRQMGMIAQEVEQVVPEVVFTNPVDGLKGINYSQTTALLVEAIKEQQKIIEDKEERIKSLEERLQRIETLLEIDNPR